LRIKEQETLLTLHEHDDDDDDNGDDDYDDDDRNIPNKWRVDRRLCRDTDPRF